MWFCVVCVSTHRQTPISTKVLFSAVYRIQNYEYVIWLLPLPLQYCTLEPTPTHRHRRKVSGLACAMCHMPCACMCPPLIVLGVSRSLRGVLKGATMRDSRCPCSLSAARPRSKWRGAAADRVARLQHAAGKRGYACACRRGGKLENQIRAATATALCSTMLLTPDRKSVV